MRYLHRTNQMPKKAEDSIPVHLSSISMDVERDRFWIVQTTSLFFWLVTI